MPFVTTEKSRQVVNAELLARAIPVFWMEDTNGNQAIDARELGRVWSLEDGRVWLRDGRLTPALLAALEATPPATEANDAQEAARRASVDKELAQGQPTLVFTDFSRAKEDELRLLQAVQTLARSIEALHRAQLGSASYEAQLPEHGPSRLLFARNQAPWCMAPLTEKDPNCSAVPGAQRRSGLYPAKLQADESFCTDLSPELSGPFTVVRERDGALVALPHHEAFPALTKKAAAQSRAAAQAFAVQPDMARYLEGVARAFETGDWAPADELWTKLEGPWYLRVGPDEVFFSPCGRKPLYHLSFGRMSERAATWRRKIDLFRQDMEQEVARLAGRPYRARPADFRLPDFVEIILNAGDSRRPHGAYIGQSLPNFGPLAESGRRRTVAMTNLYADPDSHAQLRAQAESALCGESMSGFSEADAPRIMNTAFHDVARNLGPGAGWKVRGQDDKGLFGGALAATLEELKAQAVAQHLVHRLAARDLVDQEAVRGMFTFATLWALSHFSREMYGPGGIPRPYSHLAAIELGLLQREGALRWVQEKAANGRDEGCFQIDFERLGPGLEATAREVLRIKAGGLEKRAAFMMKTYVDGLDPELHQAIGERWRRFPRASFMYGIRTPERSAL
ncbi:MAG: hypothetical protein AAGD10_08100 [Myxococcota bacterium]